MDVHQKIQALENSVSYLLSEISGERLEEMQNEIRFLLTQVEGKSKLLNLIDALQKDNEELSTRCNKLIHEKVALQEDLSQQKALVKKMRVILEDKKNSVLLNKLTSIILLLEQAQSQVDSLVSDFSID